MKNHFHFLNNGVTIVCDGLSVDEHSGQATIENFQIVNGCQTVFTLYRAKAKLDDSVRCNVRIIEGLANFSGSIAKASNSQTGVKAEQLASLETVHDSIAQELDNCSPPWYYEKQLGNLRFLTATQRRAHNNKYPETKGDHYPVGAIRRCILGLSHPSETRPKSRLRKAFSGGPDLWHYIQF